MARTTSRKQLRLWLRLVDRTPGWQWRLTGAGHYRITNPAGQGTTVPATAGDYRSDLNSRAALRRLGLDV